MQIQSLPDATTKAVKTLGGFWISAILLKVRMSPEQFEKWYGMLSGFGHKSRIVFETRESKEKKQALYAQKSLAGFNRLERRDPRNNMPIGDGGKKYHRRNDFNRLASPPEFVSPRRFLASIKENLPGWLISNLEAVKDISGDDYDVARPETARYWLKIWVTPADTMVCLEPDVPGMQWESKLIDWGSEDNRRAVQDHLATCLKGIYQFIHPWENPDGTMTINLTQHTVKSDIKDGDYWLLRIKENCELDYEPIPIVEGKGQERNPEVTVFKRMQRL